ncbi:hypothetical protein ACPW7J_07555 [Ihubacter sp. rT4E-8]|uniref:hypothetical protein n=1 Tax=Ihubacter sp. rT4E-8 TaxID=3242369 RepID=UPI003CF527F2
MVKAAGLFLAFIAASALGLLKSSEVRRRQRLLEEFRDLIAHIATEISYFKEPLPQIFGKLSTCGNEETAILMRSVMAACTSERFSSSLEDMWNQSINLAYEQCPLTSEDLAVMKKCGQFLGQSNFQGQQEHFRLLDGQLLRQISEAEEAVRTKSRMYTKLGVSTGLVIAIALL